MPSLELARSKKKKRTSSGARGKLFWGSVVLIALVPWIYPAWHFFSFSAGSACQQFLTLRKEASLLASEGERISFYSHALKQHEDNPSLSERILQEIQEIKKEEEAILAGYFASITKLMQRQKMDEAFRLCLELEKTLGRETVLERKKTILDSFLPYITPQAQKLAYLEIMGEKEEATARLNQWIEALPSFLKEKIQQEYTQAIARLAHPNK